LEAEELITTGKTIKAVRDGIELGNKTPVTFVPLIATAVHRSSYYYFDAIPVIFLVHYDFQTYNPVSCPLCAAGSKRLRPKQNWAELTGNPD